MKFLLRLFGWDDIVEGELVDEDMPVPQGGAEKVPFFSPSRGRSADFQRDEETGYVVGSADQDGDTAWPWD